MRATKNAKVIGSALLILLFSLPACALFDKEIKKDETVIFLPTIGSLTADGKNWQVDIHAWIFERDLHPKLENKLKGLLFRAAGIDVSDLSEQEKIMMYDRGADFLVDNEGRKELSVWVNGRSHDLNKQSAGHGHLYDHVFVDVDKAPKGTHYQSVEIKANTKKDFRGMAYLIPNKGISVISDIDDTIKISQVHDKKQLIRNTFLKPFEAVSGMSELYQRWAQNDVTFHYVSASPWQLFRHLKKFMDEKDFPEGSFHMKRFRWKDRTLFALFKDPFDYKVEKIQPLLERFPKRRFVLIGDSGEKDPEAYGELARRFPQQISKILIRKVSDDNESRYNNAFKNLDASLWQVFDNTSQIELQLSEH